MEQNIGLICFQTLYYLHTFRATSSLSPHILTFAIELEFLFKTYDWWQFFMQSHNKSGTPIYMERKRILEVKSSQPHQHFLLNFTGKSLSDTKKALRKKFDV